MAKKVSLRQCVGCGEMKDKKEMMRVLKSAEGLVSLDMTGRKNGRGAYLCKRGECLWKAIGFLVVLVCVCVSLECFPSVCS